jgi:hypothetical protein
MRTEQERLASYRTAFLEKVKKWNWTDYDDKPRKPRGRKAKVQEKIPAQPRTKGEQQVTNKFFNYNK